jgi:glycosyltransferase involved in cell wall biosynthesis
MRNATHNLAVSNSLASLALSQGLVVERPTVLGAGGSKGVDRSRFIPGPNRAGGEPVLGFLGRLASDKGIDTLLEVFGAVRAVYPDSRLIVGGRVDPSQPISPKTLNELRATTGVEYVGGVNDAPEFFRGIDLLVYPSSREGLPNVVIEAAACGVPVVGWDVTGVRDAIEVGRTGMVVPFGDTPALSQSAVDWATPSAEVRAACREWSASFDQVALAEHLVNFLEQV